MVRFITQAEYAPGSLQPLGPGLGDVLTSIFSAKRAKEAQQKAEARQAELDAFRTDEAKARRAGEELQRRMQAFQFQDAAAKRAQEEAAGLLGSEAPSVEGAEAGLPELAPGLVGPPSMGPQRFATVPAQTDPLSGAVLAPERKVRLTYRDEAERDEERRALASGKLVKLPDDPRLGGMAGKTVAASIADGLLANLVKAPEKRAPLQALDTKTGKPAFVGQDELEAEPDRYQPIRTGVNVNLKAPAAAGGISSERQTRLTNILPEAGDWRSLTASTPVIDSESTRGGNKAALQEWAAGNGLLYPDKKNKEIVLAAKGDLADIEQVKQLLADPEVQKDIGAYAGRFTNFLAKGWAGEGKVNPKTLRLRSSLNAMSAKKRHDIYGAAVTGTEQTFAEGFIPALDQGLDAVLSSVGEFEDNLVRGLDARFGSGELPRKGGTPRTQTAGKGADPLGLR